MQGATSRACWSRVLQGTARTWCQWAGRTRGEGCEEGGEALGGPRIGPPAVRRTLRPVGASAIGGAGFRPLPALRPRAAAGQRAGFRPFSSHGLRGEGRREGRVSALLISRATRQRASGGGAEGKLVGLRAVDLGRRRAGLVAARSSCCRINGVSPISNTARRVRRGAGGRSCECAVAATPGRPTSSARAAGGQARLGRFMLVGRSSKRAPEAGQRRGCRMGEARR